MTSRVDRRRFLGSTLACGAVSIVPRHVLGGGGHVAPSDRIALAHIGMGTQSISELGRLLGDEGVEIVAVCDPNRDSNDYVEWGKGGILRRIRGYLGNDSWRAGETGCPGGREVGREIVESVYSRRRGGQKYTGCRTYADFRELLEKEKDVDAVKVMTPDHLHATVAIGAMRKGHHVLMHKPIANRLREGRLVLETARTTGAETHLLAHGSGRDNGRICRRIREGVIGPLREIHNWTNRPVWPQYTEVPKDRPPVPEGFDWDLWLGPAQHRPYHPHYTHTVFRGWYDFGGGSMADMGIYSLWPVFTTLGLSAPRSAEAWATHTCAISDGVSRPVRNDFSYPTACALRFRFAARGDMPELDLFWYDGGMKPRLPSELEAQGVAMGMEGIVYVGDDGVIFAGFRGDGPRLFRKGRSEPLDLSSDGQSGRADGVGLWLDAARGGEASPGSFLRAGAITDAVNLGTVALRAGRKVEFDSERTRVTNAPEANRYLTRAYREGWKL